MQVCKRLVSDSVLVESWVDGSTIATMFSDLEAGTKTHTRVYMETLVEHVFGGGACRDWI